MWNVRDYRWAGSAEEAVALLRGGPGRGRYVAGGTDLLQEMPPDCDFLVDVNGAGIAGVTPAGLASPAAPPASPAGAAAASAPAAAPPAPAGLLVGAATTLQALARDPLVARFAGGALAEAALNCGSRPVRTVATIGGNLCHGLPSADMAPVLLALDARLRIAGGPGEGVEEVPLERFFVGPRRTVLGDRLLVAIVLPAACAGRRVRLAKLSRTVEDISLVQVAVAADFDRGRVLEARVALGAAAPTPMRAPEAEAALAGLAPGAPDLEERLREAGRLAAAVARPVDDHRASAAYRLAMVETLVRRLGAELIADAAAAGPAPRDAARECP